MRRTAPSCLALYFRVAGILVTGRALAAPPAKLPGTWRLVAVNTPKGPVPEETLEEGEMVWTLAADGKFTGMVTQGKETRTTKGTWVVAGKQLTISDGEHKQVVEFVVDDQVLSVTNSAEKVTLRFSRQAGKQR